ncbi:transglycosylase SLT domain-containing protein [Streptomyces sp. NPDC056084]|uniref:transglycosylase SLT domain-containing protein n=1 Tax=unclassified Streptomyces TaxID=2593676 RepID=UPI0035E2D1B7
MAISVGSVEVDVIPNTQGIYQRLRDGLVPAATRAGEDAGSAAGRAFGPAMQAQIANIGVRIGEEIGSQIAARITAAIRGAIRDGVTQGGQAARPSATKQGDETGGAFARAMKARLEAAFKSLPKIKIDANTSEADADLQALRARMEALAGKRIGVDIDTATARAEIDDIEAELTRLGAAHPDVTVRADTAKARAELAAVREEIDRISADPTTIRLQTDGLLGQRVRAAVAEAEAALPNINIDADTSEAQAQIASLRAQLTTLKEQRIGVDIDAATALARIDELQARLGRLSASSADVSVRVDAAAAQARLATIQAMVSGLDGQTARINVDTSGALGAVFQLTIAVGALAALPLGPVLAAGTGLFTSALVTAGVGVGALAAVAIPAISSISGALQAQKAAQDAATNATFKGGQAASQSASRALQAAGAQQALASAERNGAVQIAQAAEQVAQAKRGVGDAEQQAALATQQAARAVQDAERALAQSQKDATKAQLDLTAARKQAAMDLEDLNNQLTDSQLSQRDATFQVKEAQDALKKSLADPTATIMQRQQAQLAYEEAVQHLKEQGIQVARLQDKTAAANKAGVEGSDTVKQAQDKLAQAQQEVADKTRALKEAQDSQARTAVANARAIADAQQRVADSERAAAQAQAQAADSIASAQRQIASSALSAAGGVDQAAIAQAKYQQLLDKMTPAARATFNAFLSLRDAFKAWSASLQPEVMPIFTRALIGLKNSLPGLTPFVLGAAAAIKILQDRVSAGFKSPWWMSFKQDLASNVMPALLGLGIFFGQIFKGMAGIVDAFLPHLDETGSRLQALGSRFATWGTSLKGSPEFERFLAYSSEHAPMVSQMLRSIANAFFDISKALGPLADVAVTVITTLANGLSWLATNMPHAVQLMYALFVATKAYAIAQVAVNVAIVAYRGLMLVAILLTQGWTAAITAANLAFEANPIVAVVTAIIVVIGLVVAAVIYAYNHWTWFHNAVNAVWHGIAAGAVWLWQTVLQPVFSAIWTGLQYVGAGAAWLWQNAIKPAWDAIALAARILFAVVLVVLITPLVIAFRLVAAVAMWLWQNAIQPAFNGIAVVAVWLYQNIIKPYFDFVVAEFRFVASIAMWLWNNALAPAFRGIGAVAVWLWQNAIQPAFSYISDKASWLWDRMQPVFDGLKIGIGKVGASFGLAKDAIAAAWGKIHDIVKAPVQFIVDTVYNNGIRPVWNSVAKIVDLGQLPQYTFATGGILPGYTPGRDVHLAALSGGEAVMRPEWTRAVGPQYVEMMNAAARRGGVAGVQQALGLPGFSDGGIFSGLSKVGGWISSGFSQGVDLVKAGVEIFSDPTKAWGSLVKPILAKVASGVGTTQIGQAVGKLPKHMLDGLLGLIKKTVASVGGLFGGGSTGAPSGSGVTRWTPQVIQALAANGLSTSPDMVARILRQISTESGGNERAVQGDIGDINNRTGDLAKGLMQTISATFNAYKFPGHGDIFNGYDNLLAALNYAKHRYGPSLSFLGQGHGYDSGGYLQPGMNLAYNGTGRPEPVFTTQQANALTRLAVEPSGGGFGAGQPVTLVVQDGPTLQAYVADVADGQVHEFANFLTGVAGAGRR